MYRPRLAYTWRSATGFSRGCGIPAPEPTGARFTTRWDSFSSDPRSWLRPDVSVTYPDQPKDRYYQGAPLMVFEIVSKATRVRELEAKVTEFLAHGAAEVSDLSGRPPRLGLQSVVGRGALRDQIDPQ